MYNDSPSFSLILCVYSCREPLWFGSLIFFVCFIIFLKIEIISFHHFLSSFQILLYSSLTHFHLLTNYYYFKPHSLPIDAEVPIFFKSYNFFGFLFINIFIAFDYIKNIYSPYFKILKLSFVYFIIFSRCYLYNIVMFLLLWLILTLKNEPCSEFNGT